MVDKYRNTKVYRVVCKNGSHLNTKRNPDGSVAALQFTDENNDLSGPVDLIEVDEKELIRTRYVQSPQDERSPRECLFDEFIAPEIKRITTQLTEYGAEKAKEWIEEKAVPAATAKVKTGWKNLKLFISAAKDSDKPIKAAQIITEQKKASTTNEIEVSHKVGHKEAKYTLSQEDAEILLDTARQSALMMVASLSILSNAVVMDDGTAPEKLSMIQREIEQLSSTDITTQAVLLLDDKNSGLINEASTTMLRASRNGMFIGNDTPIPANRYIETDRKMKKEQ